MESTQSTELDKYLEDSQALQNSYEELKQKLKVGGFLVTLANVLVSGEASGLKFRKTYFHGEYKLLNIQHINL